jgi:hypothetical protein
VEGYGFSAVEQIVMTVNIASSIGFPTSSREHDLLAQRGLA